jgi:hypothetical protein
MSEQRHLFEPSPTDAAQRRSPLAAPPKASSALWLARTELLVRVVVRLYLGLVLLALPWTRFWTENTLFSYAHGTGWLAGNGFVRGLVSGLGLLNVGISLADLFAGEGK